VGLALRELGLMQLQGLPLGHKGGFHRVHLLRGALQAEVGRDLGARGDEQRLAGSRQAGGAPGISKKQSLGELGDDEVEVRLAEGRLEMPPSTAAGRGRNRRLGATAGGFVTMGAGGSVSAVRTQSGRFLQVCVCAIRLPHKLGAVDLAVAVAINLVEKLLVEGLPEGEGWGQGLGWG
jgi:hypothetical protein